MKFTETPFQGVYEIELEPRGDERGFFARFFCQKEFEEHAMNPKVAQVNTSFSADKGTLRGMHYQLAPRAETKVVRCIKGSLYDVIIDLRVLSPTYKEWYGVELSAENRKMLYVPEGFAHGFLTLEENTEALYLVSEFYSPDFERGIRWNDPTFNIDWPFEPKVLSEKDMAHQDFNKSYHLNMN